MKKNTGIVLALFLSLSTVLSGCSLSGDDSPKATEYLSDKDSDSVREEDKENAASAEQSIVVINDLFEPVIEELEKEDEIMAEKAAEESSEDENIAEADQQEEDMVEVVFFGDSQIANGRSDGSDIPNLLTTRVPNCKVYNLAIGGTTCAVEASTSDVTPEGLHSTSFLGMTYCLAGIADRNETLAANNRTVLDKMNQVDPSKVDYYVIEYGANDFFEGVPLDTTEYDTGKQAHSFYNAMGMGIDVLRKISPNATFIIMGPFYGVYYSSDGGYIGDSYIVSNGVGTLADYAKKAQNVSEDFRAHFMDDMFMTKCDLYLDTAGEYLTDNIHLSLKGRQIFTRLLSHYFNYLEKNEPYCYLETDFIKIAEYDTEEYYRYDERLMKMYYPESWEKYIKGTFPLAQPSQEALDEYNSENGG